MQQDDLPGLGQLLGLAHANPLSRLEALTRLEADLAAAFERLREELIPLVLTVKDERRWAYTWADVGAALPRQRPKGSLSAAQASRVYGHVAPPARRRGKKTITLPQSAARRRKEVDRAPRPGNSDRYSALSALRDLEIAEQSEEGAERG